MRQDLDYATPDRQARPPAARVVPVFAVALLATFLATAGAWSRQDTAWTSSGRWSIEATRSAWGFPHWLVFTRVRATGAAPDMNVVYLPGSEDFRPGWHVEPGALVLSLAGCVAAGLLACAAVWRHRRAHRSPARRDPIGHALAGAGVLAGAAGWASDATSGPTDVLLAFAALPLVAAAAGFAVRTCPGAALVAAAATASYWWAARLAKFHSLTDGRIDSDDLREVAVILVVATTVAVGAAFLGRRRTAARPAA